jgi:L-aspartate oxidase
MIVSNYLVVGGGIAGLTFALEVANHRTVTVLFKRSLHTSSTAWAQGGVAAVTEKNDSEDLHIQDTLVSGAGLCDERIVRMVVSEGPARIAELIARGVEFDQTGSSSPESTKYHLHQEGGHSRRRIFHSHDATGMEIQCKLIDAAKAHPNIKLIENAHAVDLITSSRLHPNTPVKNRALGVYALLVDPDAPSGHSSTSNLKPNVELFVANNILMATGGAGKVYLYTSNPDVATGDGIAMCFRAGARVANMEFFQFHPTCLYNPLAKSFLITEAMRGEGAVLKRIDGTRFMPNHHKLAEMASRDIVARAIDHELKSTGDDYVLLDIRHRGADFIKAHFPTIYATCLSLGLDITKDPIPVVPAAHFCCGGVVTDENGCTDIPHLYAAGECAFTGLHGANRLASNSLLEGLVFGYRAARHALTKASQTELTPEEIAQIPEWNSEGISPSDEQVTISQCWHEIRTFMWNYVGIVRSDKRLSRALRRSDLIAKEIDEYYWNFLLTPNLLELRNISVVANLIIKSSQLRRESRGLHFNLDCPLLDPTDHPQPTILDPNAA